MRKIRLLLPDLSDRGSRDLLGVPRYGESDFFGGWFTAYSRRMVET